MIMMIGSRQIAYNGMGLGVCGCNSERQAGTKAQYNYKSLKFIQMHNSKSQAGTKAQQSTNAEVTSSSSHNAKPHVSGSLQFAQGFVEGEGYCDAGCKAVVWENDLCMYRNECPIGCGTVWVLPSNSD